MNSLKRVHVYGHASAQPQTVADLFNATLASQVEPESDLAIFAINPAAGIDQKNIELWSEISEFQIPRLVLVTGLDGSEADFDDAVLLANRVFDQLITPYLVLHSESGDAIALIDLATLLITDYTTSPPLQYQSDDEHRALVEDFRAEYLEQLADAGEMAFAAGLLFPAIPLVISKGIGVDIVKKYISELN